MRENLHGYQNVKLQDIYGFLDQLIGNTYHGFTGKIKQKFKPIDYIFVSDDFEVVKASVGKQPVMMECIHPTIIRSVPFYA